MNENSNIVPLRQPDAIDDPLTIWCRAAARAGCRDEIVGVSCRDEWLEASRRPRPPRAAWPWAGADDLMRM